MESGSSPRALVCVLVLIMLIAGVAIASGSAQRFPKGIPGLAEGQTTAPSKNWLLDAEDDRERFRRIEIFAGGTYGQMWQIGYRYQQVYQAIIDDNRDLALHHWRKLRTVFDVALMKRPYRTRNAEDMFLDHTWEILEKALTDGDAQEIRAAFDRQRAACMACHVAEEMAFLNDTPIFRHTATFPP